MRLLQCGLLLITIAVQLVHSKVHNGTYIALCPSFLRSGLPFTVSLNILKHGKNFMAQMEIRNSKNRPLATMVKKDIKSGQPTILRIDEVPAEKLANHDEQYHVYIKGKSAEGSVLFEEKQNVILIPKSVSIFVQTDKAVYIPDSTVKFRAIIVKPDLKPYQDTVTVKIKDPKDNIVKQWLDSKLDTGVYSKSLKLANDPPLGDWKIFVEAKNGEQFNQTFSVEKYVLPKFDVTLDLPMMATIKDAIVVKVTSRYTYGNGVDASARLIVCNNDRNGECIKRKGELSKFIVKAKKLDKTGNAIFNLSKKELVAFYHSNNYFNDLVSYGEFQVKFTAAVLEPSTGIEQSKTRVVTIWNSNLGIEIKPFKDAFKPGLPNKFLVSLKQHDGSPIHRPVRRIVRVVITYLTRPKSSHDMERITKYRILQLDDRGRKILEIVPPVGTHFMNVEAYYEPSKGGPYSSDNQNYNSYDSVKVMLPKKSPTDSYLELSLMQKVVQVGRKVKFEIKVTEGQVKFGTMQVMTHGNVVMVKEFSIKGSMGYAEFTATSKMTPKSRLVIYAMREENKEILVDSAEFQVSGIFQNDVKITVDKDKAKPNEKVKIRVNTHPESFVGLVAVDKSALLVNNKNNHITTELVERAMEEYHNTTCNADVCHKSLSWLVKRTPTNFNSLLLERRKRSLDGRGIAGVGIDAYATFEKAGLFVLTDAYLFREYPYFSSIVQHDDQYMMDLDDSSRSLYSYKEKTSSNTYYESIINPILRTKFPETWIWLDSKSKSNGELVYEAIVPDTMTSWDIRAFAVQQDVGLGVAPDSVKLEVFRPFFIQLNLPYSIKRGEQMGLQVRVFNYKKSKQYVTVILKHNRRSGFEFVKRSGRISKARKGKTDEYYNVRTVEVYGNGGSAHVSFPIVATKVGKIKLRVTAVGTRASDAVEKSLLVEPEGFRVKITVPVSVQLYNFGSVQETVKLPLPSSAVPGSQTSQLVVTGSLMGQPLHNLDDLCDQVPGGCGEQNLAVFYSNVVALRYLTATHDLTDERKRKILENMERGYQNELKFKRADKSYSAFGEEDDEGSTWLTAFVARSFKHAKPYIDIEEKNIKEPLQFINKQQAENGAFEEHGEPYNWEMKPEASENGIPLTAYVLATLLENGQNNPKAQRYIEQGLNKVKDKSHSLAIATYALHLAKSSKKDKALKLLEERAIKEKGMVHWNDKVDDYYYEYSTEYPYDYSGEEDDVTIMADDHSLPIDVETTGYALLTYVLRNQMSDAEPIAQWLIKERNANGGYSSTQDTVVALQALGAYAEKAYRKDSLDRVEVDIKSGSQKKKLIVEQKNALTQQSFKLRNIKSPIHFKSTGKGSAYAQVQYSYHTTKTNKGLTFHCNKDVTQKKGGAQIKLGICCRYKKKGASNMALMEIQALSGYTFDVNEINKLTRKNKIQRVELEKDDTKANLYFSYLNHKPICVNITSRRSFPVAQQKEATVILYDYYEPSDRIEASYSSNEGKPLSKSCPHCWDGIEKKSGKCKDVADRCKQLSANRCNQNNRLAQWMHRKCRKLCKRC